MTIIMTKIKQDLFLSLLHTWMPSLLSFLLLNGIVIDCLECFWSEIKIKWIESLMVSDSAAENWPSISGVDLWHCRERDRGKTGL